MRTNLIKVKEHPEVVESSTTDGMLDLVIAFDVTGSMWSYIDSVKKYVKELVPTLFNANPNLRMGIVAFGDYCDMSSSRIFNKAYQCLEPTNHQDRIVNFIMGAESTHGGDSDEFYELVIRKITRDTSWRKEANKAVLLIGDAHPHGVGYTYGDIVRNAQIDWKEEAKEAAKLGIKFDTMTIDPTSSDWYKELSAITGGVSLPFSNAAKTQAVIEAAVYARSGAYTKDIFKAAQTSLRGDTELSSVYAAYSKDLSY